MTISDKLFINLKIISKIQKNGRITRSHDGIISLDYYTFYQPLKRFVSQDSRKQSVFEINSIVSEAINTIDSIINSKYMNSTYCNTDEYFRNYEDIVLLTDSISKAKVGIENLKFTYSTDLNIESQLDIILLKMNNVIKDTEYKINSFHKLLPEYKKNTIEQLKINQQENIDKLINTDTIINMDQILSNNEHFV